MPHRYFGTLLIVKLYSLVCVNMSNSAFPIKLDLSNKKKDHQRYGNRGEYRIRTDDLLHAMQAL